MGKTLLGVLGLVMALSICSTSVFAASPGSGRDFGDTDGNSLCDNSNSMCIYVDTNSDGVCENCGVYHGCNVAGVGCNGNFVDTDGDEICDNYATGQGNGCQGVCGKKFVDADHDGVCDNYVPKQAGNDRYGHSSQGGRGNGFRGGRSSK